MCCRATSNDNVADGLLLARDARGCYVRSERTVAVIGLEDIVIVDTPDVLLVCPRRAEEVARAGANNWRLQARTCICRRVHD